MNAKTNPIPQHVFLESLCVSFTGKFCVAPKVKVFSGICFLLLTFIPWRPQLAFVCPRRLDLSSFYSSFHKPKTVHEK